MNEILSLTHVSRFYKTVIGVGDLNLSLPEGAFGLVGPNGSGKTTLVNLLTGLLRPSIGAVRVYGKDPFRSRDVLRRIGLCPASDILYPNVSGLQWVTYLTALHGFASDEAHDRAVNSLSELGMQANMNKPIGSYSLGMRQRTKLAQATAHEPDLLILDEPFNGLDPIGRHELTAFLNRWNHSRKSLILASHILHEVEAVTSSFLLIHGGRILATGNAREVRSMLSGFPIEVSLRGRGLNRVAAELTGQSWLKGLDVKADGTELNIRVSDKDAFQKKLNAWAQLPGVRIAAVDSPDGTLEAAFDLLLKVHRGEYAA